MDFKERNTKNEYIKHIYNPIERENWKSLKDTGNKIVKIKIDVKLKDIVEQKVSLDYLQRYQIKVNQLSTLKTLSSFHLPLFDYPLPQQMSQCGKQKNLISILQIIYSRYNISLDNYTGVNNFFVDVTAISRAVQKMCERRSKI